MYYDSNSWDLLDSRFCRDMIDTMQSLENSQLQYHLGDARIIERYGKILDGRFCVGSQKYSVVIVPPCPCLGEETLCLLEKFSAEGGTVIFTEQVPEYASGVVTDRFAKLAERSKFAYHKSVSAAVPANVRKISVSYANKDKEPVSVLVRDFSDRGMTMYYIFNPLDVKHDIEVSVNGKSAALFDPQTGEEKPVYFEETDSTLKINTTLQRRGSAVLFVYNDGRYCLFDTVGQQIIKITQRCFKG